MATLEDSTGQDDRTIVADPRSEVVSLTDQTNLLPRRKVIAVFFGLSLCILVSCLDSTIVATALPTISAAFNAGSVVSWVPSAYFLTSTAFQPLCECGSVAPGSHQHALKGPLQMGGSAISSAERPRCVSLWVSS